MASIVRKAEKLNMNFVIEGNYPSGSNEETAAKLGDILNMAYASRLYQPREDFYSAVVYQDGNGKYIERQ